MNNLKKLTSLPLNWFKQLFVTARDKCVRPAVLSAMLEVYISAAMGETEEPVEPEVIQNGTDNDSAKTADDAKDAETKPEVEENEERPLKAADLEEVPEDSDQSQEDQKSSPQTGSSTTEQTTPPLDLKEVVDTLISELPDTQTMAEALSPAWTVRLFHEADRLHCTTRDRLFQLVARLLPRLVPADLAQLPPELLCEIVQQATSGGEGPAFKPELVSATIDQYLLDLAGQKRLSVDVFSKLVKVVPAETRDNHDALFQVLETLLTSGRGAFLSPRVYF